MSGYLRTTRLMLVTLSIAGMSAMGCSTGASSPSSAPMPSAERVAAVPNIVVLLADDLGIGEVGVWGQRDVATPHIDQLAAEGLRFTEFRSSAAVCGPARCSFMTGLHNGRCRLDDNDNDYLRPTDVTLAERLHDAGYATALVGKWGLSWESKPESWPHAQGFDVFFGYRDQVHAHNFYPEYLLDGTDSLRTRNVVPAPRGMGSGYATVRLDYAPDLLRERAFRFVRKQAEARTPFFLFWATNLPHIHNETSRSAPDGGYETPTLGPYATKPWSLPKRSYAAQIHRLDEDLGALRALLDSMGVARQTMIVFLSDNGATFLRGPHDGVSDVVGRWFNGTLGYRGFKGDLYDGGLRVPGIVHWPGTIAPGRTTNARVDFTDLHATLVDVAGERASPVITGRSFLPLLTGRGRYTPRDAQVWYSPDRRQSAVLYGQWKAVWMLDTMRVFNLARDPGEQVDMKDREPKMSARLDSIRRAEDQRVRHPPLPGNGAR
jgi:arylsulfatase A-like enzyme